MSALEEEREFLARSLLDLDAERDAGDIDADDYATLKHEYTARAAAVERALESQPEPPRPASRPRARSRWRPVAWVSGIVAFAVVAGLLVAHGAGQRAAGQTLNGNPPPTGADADLAQASKDLGNGDYLGALRLYDKIIRTDPTNAPALAYRGWVLVLSGRAAKDTSILNSGVLSLQAAEKADPSLPDSHFFLGMILLEDKNDPSAAAAEFRNALADNVPASLVPEVQRELQIAEGLAGSTTTSTTRP